MHSAQSGSFNQRGTHTPQEHGFMAGGKALRESNPNENQARESFRAQGFIAVHPFIHLDTVVSKHLVWSIDFLK
jgi:hypothetical protein